MNNEVLIIEQALTHLREFTGDVWHDINYKDNAHQGRDEVIDGIIEVATKDGKHLRLYTEIKTEFKPYHLSKVIEMARHYTPFILIAERIYPAQKQALKASGINYLDAAGNIFFRFKQLYLYVEGNKPVDEIRPVANRAFTKTGLKAVFHFLLNEEFLNMPYRVLAQATGVSLGNINYILDGLQQSGFILQVDAQTKRLQQKRTLLDRWVAGYHQTLKPSLFVGAFNWGKDQRQQWKNMVGSDGTEVWGGEPAADLLTDHLLPQLFTLYTQRDKVRLMRDWRLIPQNDGDIKVYQRFWSGVEWDEKKIAPPLLVYADLIETNDPRCIETAEIIYNQFLKHEFE